MLRPNMIQLQMWFGPQNSACKSRVHETEVAMKPDRVNEYRKLVSYTASKKLVGWILTVMYLNLPPGSSCFFLRVKVWVSRCFVAMRLLNLLGNKIGSRIGFYIKQESKYKSLSKFDRRNLTPSVKAQNNIIFEKPTPSKICNKWSLSFLIFTVKK